MKRLACTLTVVHMVAAAALSAQTRAIVSDVRLITEKTGSSPDTVLMRTVTAGRRSRIEYLTGSAPMGTQFPGMDGKLQLISFSDTSFAITFVDTTAKTYFTFDLLGMMKGLSKMTEDLGGGAKIAPQESVTVDSIGEGDVVAGYKTVHFRVHSTMRMTAGMFGDSSAVAISQITDSYHAPDLLNVIADSSLSAEQDPSGILASLAGTMPGMDQMISQAGERGKRLRKAGLALKTVSSSRTNLGGLTIDSRSTMEMLTCRVEVVPDQLLSIPVGYKKTEPTGFPTGN